MTNKEKRNLEIIRHKSNAKDCGGNGRAFELECVRDGSRKTKVSKQGEKDVSVKILRNGRPDYAPAECKTNGGRIETLLNGTNKAEFVIYRLETVQKHKATKNRPEWVEERVVPPVIIPVHLFVKMVVECNAYKVASHNQIEDGIQLQPSSKKMFLRLTAYAENYPDMIFDNKKVFEDWQFEGLEL